MSEHGDEIQGTVGDDAHTTAIGKDIKQETTTTGGNVVNVYPSLPKQQRTKRSGGDTRQGLSVAAEERLRGEIGELRKIIHDLSVGIGGLTVSLRNETDARRERSESQERIINQLANTLKTEIDAADARLATVERIADRLSQQAGRRDPLAVAIGVIIIAILIVIAAVLINSGGL